MVLIAGIILLIALYALLDPGQLVWAPKCPLYVFTGLQCPGCGSQRAIHALLTGNVADAWHYNALMVASLPLLTALAWAWCFRTRHPRAYAMLNSVPVIVTCAVAIVAWFFIRNFCL